MENIKNMDQIKEIDEKISDIILIRQTQSKDLGIYTKADNILKVLGRDFRSSHRSGIKFEREGLSIELNANNGFLGIMFNEARLYICVNGDDVKFFKPIGDAIKLIDKFNEEAEKKVEIIKFNNAIIELNKRLEQWNIDIKDVI